PFAVQPVVAVPLSEIITISRHIEARSITSFMNVAPLRDLRDANTPPPRASDSRGRSSQRFAMDVLATCDGERRRITASGQDIYAVSAPLAVEACMRIIERPPSQGGTFAAGELFEAAGFLAALGPAVVIVAESAECGLGSFQAHHEPTPGNPVLRVQEQELLP